MHEYHENAFTLLLPLLCT